MEAELIPVSIPLPVLALLAIAHAKYDPVGRVPLPTEYSLLGHGISVGLCLWTAAEGRVPDGNGGTIECVRLSKRENFHTGTPDPEVDYFLPLEQLREALAVELPILLGATA